jgi:hypothetical protein
MAGEETQNHGLIQLISTIRWGPWKPRNDRANLSAWLDVELVDKPRTMLSSKSKM